MFANVIIKIFIDPLAFPTEIKDSLMSLYSLVVLIIGENFVIRDIYANHSQNYCTLSITRMIITLK
jgi:hypothetical protein